MRKKKNPLVHERYGVRIFMSENDPLVNARLREGKPTIGEEFDNYMNTRKREKGGPR
jgi:hypothetical protein